MTEKAKAIRASKPSPAVADEEWVLLAAASYLAVKGDRDAASSESGGRSRRWVREGRRSLMRGGEIFRREI